MGWPIKVAAAALVAVACAGAALASASGDSQRRQGKPTCTYDPVTKVVTFAFPGDDDPETFDIFQPYLTRSGDKLVFKAAYNKTLTCAGGVPTVDNTDRIDLTSSGPDVDVLMTLVLTNGPLAPGATPEGSKPEIEIDSTIPDLEIEITPSDEQEDYTFGQSAEGPAANLNADEPSADLDIVLHDLEPPRRHDDFIFSIAEYSRETNAGDDVYSAAGGEGFTGPFPYNVLFVGGTGKDRLTGSLANDTIYGGEDKDVLAGGEGNDRINALGAQRDRVDCGPGKDLAEATDRDIVKNCERIADDNFKGEGRP